ncbi:hypothetical protein ACFUJX_29950 [Streptomyces rubiginosohelvolus]|uniref:hypothetical protein n=1 Tax=Streptomyces rubiginosohelvolus TaxID=67362 RepID=UPI0036443678
MINLSQRQKQDGRHTPNLWPVWLVAPGALLLVALAAYGLYHGTELLLASESTGKGKKPVSVQDVVKTTVTVLTLIGAVLAALYAYRKQLLDEGTSHRADATQLTERYTKAAEQLGHEQAAVRLAGVYAMARLADDWPENQPGAAAGAIARRRDRVPVQGTVVVVVFAHPERGVAQPGEEVGRAGNGGGGLADGALEALPGSFRETAAGQPSPEAPPATRAPPVMGLRHVRRTAASVSSRIRRTGLCAFCGPRLRPRAPGRIFCHVLRQPLESALRFNRNEVTSRAPTSSRGRESSHVRF